ncbi:MAG: hypothetical protein WBW04_02825 [Nitrolancea sp.]
MNPAILRARQIKALYQREITALNRNPHLGDEERREHAVRLWRQATDQIARLRDSVAAEFDSFDNADQKIFDPPRRPAYLDKIE